MKMSLLVACGEIRISKFAAKPSPNSKKYLLTNSAPSANRRGAETFFPQIGSSLIDFAAMKAASRSLVSRKKAVDLAAARSGILGLSFLRRPARQ